MELFLCRAGNDLCQKTEACKQDVLTVNGNPTATGEYDEKGVVTSVGLGSPCTDHDRV